MSGLETKREIEQTLASGSYGSWTIGITDYTAFARAQLQNPECWHSWQADSPEEAKSLQSFFISKKMRTGSTSGRAPTYVYIY